MAFDIASLAPNLERRDSGIWFVPQQGAVSYPAEGNATCLAVEERSFWFRHRNRCIVSLVRHYPPAGVFFDIGGGNGYVAMGLAAAGIDCVLVEPGIDGALAAHTRGIDPVVCARFEDISLPPARIAAVGMFDVIEHIEDDVAVLRRVHSLLRPSGRLFLTVPAYQFLFSPDDAMAGHFRRYSRSSLARLLDRCGFRAEFASYMFSPLPPLIFLLRTVPGRLGLRRGLDPGRDMAEHAPSGIKAWLMGRLLDAEYRRIDTGCTLFAGGSCLCVAVKV